MSQHKILAKTTLPNTLGMCWRNDLALEEAIVKTNEQGKFYTVINNSTTNEIQIAKDDPVGKLEVIEEENIAPINEVVAAMTNPSTNNKPINENKTKVTVLHSGLEQVKDFTLLDEGWSYFINKLRELFKTNF